MASKHIFKLKRTHLVMFAGVPMATYTVYAAEDKPSPRKIAANQLPLYGNPEDNNEYKFEQENITPFREGISSVRQSVWKYLDSIKETTDYVQGIYQTGKAHTLGFVDYVQSDPGILPRAGVITVAGLGGVVAGYRGGIIKKVAYSSIAMAAAASLCYPDRAVEISTSAYDSVAFEAKALWASATGSEVETSAVKDGGQASSEAKRQPDTEILKKIEEIETHVLQKPSKTVEDSGQADNSIATDDPKKPADSKLLKKIEEIETHVLHKPSKTVEDFGQSKPEDKDLYTTRS